MKTVNHNQVKAMFTDIGFDDHLAEYLARDIVNIDQIMRADASDEEKREAVEFAVECIVEKLEISELIPPLGPLRGMLIKPMAELMITIWQQKSAQ
jgi:hypothetical protein